MATVHIIGAGISGLAAATALAEKHIPVKLYEATTQAGGRCRSSSDSILGTIDHGLHVFSGAARHLWRYIDSIDARGSIISIPLPLPVIDLKGGHTMQLGGGYLPYLPVGDAACFLGALLCPGDQRVEAMVHPHSPLQDHLLSPLSRLALTRPAHQASVSQLQRLMRRQTQRGGRDWYMVEGGLQAGLIAPALARLEYYGGSVYFGQALKGLEQDEYGVRQLHFTRKKVPLAEGDLVILATPAPVARQLLPALPVPLQQHCAITLHFSAQHTQPAGSLRVLANAPYDLLRYENGIICASIRLADHAWQGDEEALAARVWRATRQLHPALPNALPHWSSCREKRAGHVPLDHALPAPALAPGLLLAGDWLDARNAPTLESAAASGYAAATAAQALLGSNPLRQQSPFY